MKKRSTGQQEALAARKQAQLQPDTQVKGQTARNTGAKSDLTWGEQGRSFEEGVGVSGKRRERQERHAERKGKKKLEIDHQSTRTSSSC